MDDKTRKQIQTRWSALKSERSSWDTHWRDLSEHIQPRTGRFLVDDRNKGERKYNKILDNTATKAARILSAGMMSGMTSPARPWFSLTTPDPDLNKFTPVKIWLNDVTELMNRVFQKSNTYRSLQSMYSEIAVMGTAANIIVPDFNNVIHNYPLTTGEYCIAQNWKGEIVTLYREFQKTVYELVSEFGLNNVSTSVKSMYDNGNMDAWVTVIHAIEPRTDRDASKLDSLNMPWRSVYFEQGSNKDGKVLRESGFKRFPVLAPRWDIYGGDIYGTSPAMEALGDIRQLQFLQKEKAKAISYKVSPPLQVPGRFKNNEFDLLPGGISFVDDTTNNQGVRSAFEVNLDLSHLLNDIQDTRQRINSAFYVDMFLMISQVDNGDKTAREVAELHEEKLLMLGPVVERFKNEVLDPLIEITFDAMMEAKIVPPPPQELQGKNIDVELVSIIAQAQKAAGITSLSRFASGVGSLAQVFPGITDNIDPDALVGVMADQLGVDPRIVRDPKDVEAMRQQQAQAQQQAQQAAMANQSADTAQKLSNADTSQPNALTALASAIGGGNEQ